ncbi:hypothetical protein Tco_1084064 [Tanacetum coccineum]
MNNKRIKSTKSTHKIKKHKPDKPDPFFSGGRKTKLSYDDGDNDSIKSSESEDEVYNEGGDDVAVEDGDGDDDVAEETAGEKRKRVAEAYLEKMREMARREIEEEDDDVASDGDVEERVGKMLHKQQMEDSGRARRLIAKR